MIASCACMNNINTELVRTQNEFSLPLATNTTNSNELTSPEFVSFRTSSLLFIADFVVHDLFHRKERKGRKDCLIGLYAINHRVHREHRVAVLCVLCALCGFSKLKIIKSALRGEL